jgi:ASC-1-like (ASCH) protein
MQTHQLQLADEPFRAIAAGTKTIESRLFDAKRSRIQPGDVLLFVNRERPQQIQKARVTQLHRYAGFEELFRASDPAKFGKPDAAALLAQIRQFYSEADEKHYGVVGIEFERV